MHLVNGFLGEGHGPVRTNHEVRSSNQGGRGDGIGNRETNHENIAN